MQITWKTISALRTQIQSELRNEHIQKIYQISSTDILFKFHKSSLLISCNPNLPRIHITTKTYENPPAAPNFCMLLRKHLMGAKLINITQPEGERILDLTFESKNELGDKMDKHIIAEIMGRNSNIILMDENYKILGTLRQGGDLTSVRPLIAGMKYELPPKQDKVFECEDVISENISAEIEQYFEEKANKEYQNNNSRGLFEIVENKKKIASNKLKKLQKELKDAQNREQDKLFGELLTANIYRLVGDDGNRPAVVGADDLGRPWSVELENYYDNNNLVKIPLDKKLNIPQNAAKYYKKYEKKSRAEKHIIEQIAKTEEELEYLDSIQISLDLAETKSDFDEIREELGLSSTSLRAQSRNNKNIKFNGAKQSKQFMNQGFIKPSPFTTIDDFPIYVGKNNIQNDYLSLKFAQNMDVWLHIQKQAGSHVIIRTNGKTPPPNVLEAAALLAKSHSKAKNENKATIDYCLAKYVKKPKSAKAGFVTYSNFSSIIV